MPQIHVCSLDRIEERLRISGSSHMVSLLRADYRVPRPAHIRADQHLHLGMSDISQATAGYALPAHEHVDALIAFARDWDQKYPMLIHCFAGVSRSTAAAMIVACALRPDWPERDIAKLIRARSPTATPNRRLISLGDAALQRGCRMVEAVQALGDGEGCLEGVPFHINIR